MPSMPLRRQAGRLRSREACARNDSSLLTHLPQWGRSAPALGRGLTTLYPGKDVSHILQSSTHTHTAPFLHTRETVSTMMGDVVIALIPLYFIATVYYGLRVVLLGLTGLAVCILANLFSRLITGRIRDPLDLSAAVTGLILPLLLPASAPYRLVVIACLFAILVVKLPFGGVGNNPFNPAAAGFAFVAFCWPELVFRYPVPLERLPLWGDAAANLVESPAFSLMNGAVPGVEKLELVLGYFAGPMGATNVLILVFCFLYLLLRRTVSWRMTVPFLLACALFAFLFPRIEVAPHYSVLYELFSGQLVFGAIFILNDPVTTPKRPGAQVLYGAVTGVITMLFRYFGGFEVGLIFAVLVMNVFTPMIDRGFENAIRLERRGRHALIQAFRERNFQGVLSRADKDRVEKKTDIQP